MGAGAEGLATALVVGAVVLLLWYRMERRRRRDGARPRWLVALPAGAAVMVGGALLAPTFVSTEPSTTRPVTDARLEIVSPVSGQALSGGKVQVRLRLRDAKLAPLNEIATGDLPPDRGHIHLYVDGRVLM